MTSIARHIAHLALLLISAGLMLACSAEQSPQERLEHTLHDMQEAAVAGEIGDFMAQVAEDFSGQQGNFDRRALNDMLRVQLLKHSRITATIMSDEYTMFEGRASVELSVLLTGGPGNWLPDSGRVYKIKTGWRDQEQQWFLISATWE